MQVSLVTLRVEEAHVPAGNAWEEHVREVRERMLGEAPITDPVADEHHHESVYRTTQLADQVFTHIVKVPAVRIADWEARVVYDVPLTGEGDDLHASGFSISVADGGDVERADLLTRAEAILIAMRFVRADREAAGAAREPGGRASRPDLAEVAAVYREATTARNRRDPGEPRVSVRRYVQRAFGAASLQTVDGWIRAARDAGLIPPASTGKPRSGPATDRVD
jgi:hypothetical protein